MDETEQKKANEELQELLLLRYEKATKRMDELEKQGKLIICLDGENYCEDIDAWFKTELNKLRKKYGLEEL